MRATKIPTFKEFINEQRKINEMPQYIDHDYLPFEPISNRSMQMIENRFEEIAFNIPNESFNVPKDLKIYINKRKTMVLMGLTVWQENRGSWVLEVATWLKLEKNSKYSEHYQIKGVHTKEEITGSGYAVLLYYSLAKAGIKLESDHVQYQGAKPLWKALSRLIPVEVLDFKKDKVKYPIYDERKIKDSEIWSEDDKHFLKTLRVK